MMKENVRVKMLAFLVCASIWMVASGSVAHAAGGCVVFDSDSGRRGVGHYTHSWVAGSNLKPVGTTVTKGGEKLLRITYQGTQGIARTAFDCRNRCPAGTLVRGVRITCDSNLPEHGKLHVEVCFSDHTAAVFSVPTHPGMRSYELTKPHFKTSKQPMDWNKITFICLDNKDLKRVVTVRKVELMTAPPASKPVTISFDTLPVAEVVPQHFSALSFPPGAPLQAQLKLQDAHLVLRTQSSFPERPKATITRHDDSVFVDEALEIFFSPELDNRSFRQIVLNGLGTVFDLKFGFDPVAASFIYKKDWTIPLKKTQSYENQVWHNQVEFPLDALNHFDWRKERLMGFQLVQDYARVPKVKPIWSPATFYPTPRKFGLLCFNHQPFGEGSLSIRQIQASRESQALVTFALTLEGRELPMGSYLAHVDVTSPLFERYHSMQQVRVDKRQFTQRLICQVPCQNGMYNLYVTLENQQKNRLGAAASFAYSIPLQMKFGQAILCPEPKQIRVNEGSLHLGDCQPSTCVGKTTARTRQTAAMLTEELSRYLGRKPSGNKPMTMAIAPSVMIRGQKIDLKREGYFLRVTPQGIDMVGADEPGLYYATRTLMQLALSPGKDFKRMPVPCVEILDWPDTTNRIFRLPHPDLFKGMELKDFRGVEYLLKDFERFVAMQKFNVLELDITSMTRFRRQPEFNGSERVFTLADWTKIAQFCRDRFIRFVPALQVGGHENVWFLGYHPELRMPGYRNTGDVRNLRHNQIILNCLDDLLDATQPELFLVKADEWYQHRKSEEEGLKPEEYRKAFIDCLKLCHSHLKSRGVRMAVFDDMLNPMTNGVKFDIYRTLSDVPKDVLIFHWGGMPVDASVDYFTSRGFEVWASLTSVAEYKLETRKKLGGYGTATYGAGRYYELRKPIGDSCSSADSVFYGAEVAWNLLREKHPSFISKIADGTYPALRERASFQAVPQGTENFFPLKLVQAKDDFSVIVSRWLPGVQAALPGSLTAIGHVPMNLSGKITLLPMGKTTRLTNLNSACASLIFLFGAWARPHTLAELNRRATNRQWPYGRPAGEVVITFDDGSQERIPIRHQENFDLLDTHALNRSTMWNRYVLPIKTQQDRHVFLYQFQWVNPQPSKKISAVDFKHLGIIDFKMFLAALTAEAAR